MTPADPIVAPPLSPLPLAQQVAQTLHASRTAHLSWRISHHRAELETAARLRREAFALDPERSVPAWAAEQTATPKGKDSHLELLAFFDQQLAKP